MGNKVGIEYASFGLQGRRPTMEDAEATITNYGGKPTQAFFGIFDGHVGPQCSKYVSQNLPKLLLKESSFGSDTKDALTSAFFKCDKDWLLKAKASTPVLKDGSTGVVVLLKDQKIYCANTGDSRSVMYQAGKVVPLSFDQKPEDPAEQRRFVAKKNVFPLFFSALCVRLIEPG
jgi:serine/threonine protein phosphatase PrpC